MVDFNFNFGTVSASDSLDRYNSLRARFLNMARLSATDFDKKYSSYFIDIDEVYLNFPAIVSNYTKEAVDVAIRELIFFGIADYSDERFIEKYINPISTLLEDCAYIDEAYLKIVMGAEEYEQARKSRSVSGGFIGGGFGLEGAAQGIAMATAANLAVGVFSGAISSLGAEINKKNMEREKIELFSNPKVRESLVCAVYNSVFNVHLSIVNAISEAKEFLVYEVISQDRVERAGCILTNIERNRVPRTEVAARIIEAIALDPYSAPAYEELWLRLPEGEDAEALRMCKYFGVSTSFCPASEGAQSKESFEPLPFVETKMGTEKKYHFDGAFFDSQEEADGARAQYFSKILVSRGNLDLANKNELALIVDGDKELSRVNAIAVIGVVISVVVMIQKTPWWHGFLLLVAISVLFVLVESRTKKKIIKKWIHSKRHLMSNDSWKCPSCGEKIEHTASSCRFCHTGLDKHVWLVDIETGRKVTCPRCSGRVVLDADEALQGHFDCPYCAKNIIFKPARAI